VCDQSGCGYNPYRLDNPDYYGPHGVVDTTRPFTVTTQFIPAAEEKNFGFSGGSGSDLVEIRRLYVQDGRVIPNAPTHISSLPASQNFIDDAYCEASGATQYMDLGALKGTGQSLHRGMVLAFSLWWDPTSYMDWLDADGAGPCGDDEGNPTVIEAEQPDLQMVISNIKWGEIGSTY
jgi:cellulase